MPWLPEYFNETISKAKDLILKHFEISPSASVYLCSYDELSQAVLEELKDLNFSKSS